MLKLTDRLADIGTALSTAPEGPPYYLRRRDILNWWCARVNSVEDSTLDEFCANRYETATAKALVCFNIRFVGNNHTRAAQPVVACRQPPYLHLLSLWHHSHYDVSRLRCSQPPLSLWRHSHCDVIRYWAGHAHRYRRTDTLPRLIYKDTTITTRKYGCGKFDSGRYARNNTKKTEEKPRRELRQQWAWSY